MGYTGGASIRRAPTCGTSGGEVPSGGALNRVEPSMENLLGALATLMEQQRRQAAGGYGFTKALKGVVDKIERFDGKNVTNFLKVYLFEIEVHQIPKDHMIQAFGLVVVLEIRDWI